MTLNIRSTSTHAHLILRVEATTLLIISTTPGTEFGQTWQRLDLYSPALHGWIVKGLLGQFNV